MMRRAAGLGVAIVAFLLLGALARAPFAVPAEDTGILRLSWRLRGERVETCRTRTQAELDALPVHMRTPEVCEGGFVPYRLVVQIDEAPADTTELLPAGARGDRPVFVMSEYALPVGERRVRVSVARADGLGEQLTFDERVTAAARMIQLVTLSSEGALVLVSRGEAEGD